MKKLAILICTVALLLAFTNVAMATKPTEQSFEISVFALDPFPPLFVPLNECLYRFSMGASGTVQHLGDSIYFDGTFDYTEKGVINLCTGHGTNQGVMIITTTENETETSTVTIRFQGQTNDFQVLDDTPFLVGTVSGNFVVLEGTSAYEDLHGRGTYVSTVPGNLFTVTFTGQFHNDPQ